MSTTKESDLPRRIIIDEAAPRPRTLLPSKPGRVAVPFGHGSSEAKEDCGEEKTCHRTPHEAKSHAP